MIHGISQGGKNPEVLKEQWIEALTRGFEGQDLELPSTLKFDFPYYGDILDGHVQKSGDVSSSIAIEKGAGSDSDFVRFSKLALGEIQRNSDITNEEIEECLEPGFREKSAQNWAWVRAIARQIDKRFESFTEYTIDNFLREVYLYLNDPDVVSDVNSEVDKHLTDEPTIVIGHSLGSVVGYRVLSQRDDNSNFLKYVTVGSPLGLRVVGAKIGRPRNLTNKGWFNAFDRRDIVALNPLDDEHFFTDPPIRNYGAVKNHTDNRHGIDGYLDDGNVASVIADVLGEQ